MNAAINALTAPDQYDAASTLDTGRFVNWFNIDVYNQAIYWSIKQAAPRQTPGMAQWGPDIYMGPGSRTIQRVYVAGMRFRAAIKAANLPAGAAQAVVTLEVT